MNQDLVDLKPHKTKGCDTLAQNVMFTTTEYIHLVASVKGCVHILHTGNAKQRASYIS